MSVVLSPLNAWTQFFGGNTAASSPNNPLSGGLLNIYAAGTTTPVTTYTSSSGLTANTNPIVLDSAGRLPGVEIWWTAGSSYKFVLMDASSNIIPDGTWDNIPGINDTTGLFPIPATSVSFTPTGGSATTVAAFLNTFNQLTTGQFFQSSGANIDRLNDRLLVGDATLMTGNSPGSGSWLDTYSNTFAQGSYYNDFAQFASMSSVGSGVGGYARTATGSAGANAYGGSFIGIANNTAQTYAWGLYVEGHRMTGATTSDAWGMEMGVVNRDSVVDVDAYGPYSSSGTTIALQLNSGSGFATGTGTGQMSGQANSSCAAFIQSNPTQHRRGIVFGNTAIATNEVMTMATSHFLQWYIAQNTKSASITCTNTAQTNAMQMSFNDTFGLSFLRALDSSVQFAVLPTAAAVNYLYLAAGATGNPPVIVANGSDTVVDLQLSTKGGTLRMGNPTMFEANGTNAVTISNLGPSTLTSATIGKWFRIKDSNGNVWCIPAWAASS